MKRAHWSSDYADAHVVEAMLKANGLHAWVFDAGVSRIDWFKTLAYGGYRVMVPDGDFERARALVASYRDGALEVGADDGDGVCCPRCGTGDAISDPGPRRRAFALLIASDVIAWGLASTIRDAGIAGIARTTWFIASTLAFGALCLATTSRYRCAACKAAWRAQPSDFATLSHTVDAATREAGGERP